MNFYVRVGSICFPQMLSISSPEFVVWCRVYLCVLNSVPHNTDLTTPRKKTFENIVGKEENAGNQHFLLFPQCFLTYQRQKSFMLSSAKAFNLLTSKILSFGKELHCVPAFPLTHQKICACAGVVYLSARAAFAFGYYTGGRNTWVNVYEIHFMHN